MVPFPELSPGEFAGQYWRRKPYLAPGGAKHLVDFQVDKARFLTLCEELERVNPRQVRRLPDGTIFAQNLDAVSEDMRRVSHRLERQWHYQRVWFDGAYARDGGGLGAHYDQSDVFLLQQEGRKRWRLQAPDGVPESELRLRMLGAPNGEVPMSPPWLEFDLEEGDCLYLPLFWPHDGISVGESVSLSLTLVSECALSLMGPGVKQALSELPGWWRPLPTLPEAGGDEGRRALDEEMDRLFDRLLDDLGNREFRARVKEAWWDVYRSSPPSNRPHRF